MSFSKKVTQFTAAVMMLMCMVTLIITEITVSKKEREIDDLNFKIEMQADEISKLQTETKELRNDLRLARTLAVGPRYANIEISNEERTLMAFCIYHEARGESFEGQRAVAEVILNRVLNPNEFPFTVKEVIYQKGQFECASYLTSKDITEPDKLTMAYEVIDYVLTNDDYILDYDVGYFRMTSFGDRTYTKIGCHYFAKM